MKIKPPNKTIFSIVLLGVMMLVVFFWLKPERSAKPAPEATWKSGEDVLVVNELSTANAHPIVKLAKQSKPSLDEEEARLKNWKENFPFKPLHPSTLKHDPELYDANDSSTWKMPEDSKERMLHEYHQVAVRNHGYLGNFHENPLRYTKEFEQLYHLLGEFDRNDNAINVAKIFTYLCYYHRASRHDPDELETKSMPYYNEETGEHGIHQVPLNGSTTWGDDVKSSREGIAFMLFQERVWPGKEQMPPGKSWELADYIIETIPAENLLKIPHMTTFAFNTGHEKALKEGDPFLIPKEGFMEAYYENYLKKNEMPIYFDMEGKPEVLIRGEDGQFYDKATGEVFMPGVKPLEIKPGEIFEP
ncbi:MAG: hypothetical protein HOH33_13125 [Verrucomicrobia bacterium]|jgi:hypothetical protein|nr:hypothetical protein [Verrucomicrobiota bacterium]